MIRHAELEDRERGACRSPDWATDSAVDSALVEREWRREAAGTGRGGHAPQCGTIPTPCIPNSKQNILPSNPIAIHLMTKQYDRSDIRLSL